METEPLVLTGNRNSGFKSRMMNLLPDGGNLNLCLTCGLCSSGCPASGIDDMDPRRFLRMISLGMEEEALKSPWVWACTMCQRCIYACPMQIDIPQLIYHARASWPREERPKGIIGSCDTALKTETCSAMGLTEAMFQETVEDLLEEVREDQEGFKDLAAPLNKKGAHFLLNQNSREPQMEEDEMVPLWKILHLAEADWTYNTKGWAAENYCMFLADDEAWEKNVRIKAKAVEELGCKVWLNTE